MLTDLRPSSIMVRSTSVEPAVLEYIAFTGQRELAHGLFRSISHDRWDDFSNKFVLSEVIAAGVDKLHRFLAVSAEDAAMDEKIFLDRIVRFFLDSSRRTSAFHRELFESLLLWADELIKLSLLPEALTWYEEMLSSGIDRFPDLKARAVVGKARLLSRTGRNAESGELLSSLAARPYLISDRNMMPELMFDLGTEMLMSHDAAGYKGMMFRGLRHFYSTMDQRRRFVAQIKNTYRHSHRALLDRTVSVTDRLLFAAHAFYFRLASGKTIRALGIATSMKMGLLAWVYWLHYGRRSGRVIAGRTRVAGEDGSVRLFRADANRGSKQRLLITRAMGGIGDLLMMTPGLHAVRKRYPGATIHFAIPRRYFPLLAGNPDVELMDIDDRSLDPRMYSTWINLSDCPAARIESRTSPKVRTTRIDAFASAMGIGPIGRLSMNHRPRYFLTDAEKAFRREYWKRHGLAGRQVIGVQVRADETYRDYPHMDNLISYLSKIASVMVFDVDGDNRHYPDSVVRIAGQPLRTAFALASGCDVIVGPDSAFIHLAAALEIPCIGLFGPIDGKVRTKHYPRCTFIDIRDELGCLPCWRNEKIPCKLTNMRHSACMANITVERIGQAVRTVLGSKS